MIQYVIAISDKLLLLHPIYIVDIAIIKVKCNYNKNKRLHKFLNIAI